MRRPFQWAASSEAIQTDGDCMASGWMSASAEAPSGGMTMLVAVAPPGVSTLAVTPVPLQVLGHDGHQGLVAGLGRAVGGAALAPHGVHAGGDADDASEALLDHVGRDGVGHQEGAAEVDADYPQPGVGRDGIEIVLAAGGLGPEPAGAGVDAGVVHQDVQAAHLADGALHGVPHRFGVGDVGGRWAGRRRRLRSRAGRWRSGPASPR